ncbi:MAG: hypothetical protein M1337_06245, partial [Actinobacteria bacterium]|nr:hypothetical protein [Actinomycetota bacterium]
SPEDEQDHDCSTCGAGEACPYEDEDETLGDESPATRTWWWWASRTAIGVVILAAVVGAVWGDHWSRRTSTCAACHVLEPIVQTWTDGSHADVECVACHDSQGAFGGVETRVRAAFDVVANLSAPRTVLAPVVVDQAGCRSCHASQMRGVVTAGRMRVRHADFVSGVSCALCHGRVGHQTAGAASGGLASGVMSLCAECHDGVKAPKACSTCHVGDISGVGTGGNSFAKIDLGVPKTCRGCHSLERCTACHGIEMPHPKGWGDPKQHARAGAFDTTVCVRCHDANCQQCHTMIHSNHGPQWRTEHQRGDPTRCSGFCHNRDRVGDNMCLLCHPSGTR